MAQCPFCNTEKPFIAPVCHSCNSPTPFSLQLFAAVYVTGVIAACYFAVYLYFTW